MKALPIKSCQKCIFFDETPYPTSDSWEHATYWWCKHPEVFVIIENDETERYRKNSEHLKTARKIQGYVEWRDEKDIKIPEFCPLPDMPETPEKL